MSPLDLQEERVHKDLNQITLKEIRMVDRAEVEVEVKPGRNWMEKLVGKFLEIPEIIWTTMILKMITDLIILKAKMIPIPILKNSE